VLGHVSGELLGCSYGCLDGRAAGLLCTGRRCTAASAHRPETTLDGGLARLLNVILAMLAWACI